MRRGMLVNLIVGIRSQCINIKNIKSSYSTRLIHYDFICQLHFSKAGGWEEKLNSLKFTWTCRVNSIFKIILKVKNQVEGFILPDM